MKLGLKLWSTNTDYYYNEALRLYQEGVFDYIELYVVPDTTDTIEKWKQLNIPFTLHAPHFAHNINLSCPQYFEYNQNIYKQVETFRQELNAIYTIVHGGTEGCIDETISQLNIIKPKNILIENKPYKAPLGKRELCRGYNIVEITKIMDKVGCEFCLDIGHAICTANSLGLEPYEYVKTFNQLHPAYYHLSDGYINSDVDMHLNINRGNYDFKKIFNIINCDKYITLETQKNSKENLHAFIQDVIKIRNYV